MITRALIIKKEYADLILTGEKTWEMRSTKTNIRGRVGIIESGSGTIVGEVDIVDSLPKLKTPFEKFRNFAKHRVSNLDLLRRWNTPWVLENAIRYDFPISYNHPKGDVIWVKL